MIELLGMELNGWLALLGMLPFIAMADTDDDNDDDKDDDKDEKMVKMSQKALNKLIDDRGGAMRAAIEKEYKDKIEVLNNSVNDLTEKLKSIPTGDGDDEQKKIIDTAIEKATGEYKKTIEGLEKNILEVKGAAETETKLRKQETKRALIGAQLADLKVLKPDEVFAVLEYNKAIGFDNDGNLIPVTPEGNAIIGDGGEPKTLDKFLTEYIDARPHLVAPSGNTGSDANNGAGDADKGDPKDDEDFMRTALDEADESETGKPAFTHGK